MRFSKATAKKVAVVIFGLPVLALSVVLSGPASEAAPNGIEAVYKSKCASCHAADGSGNTAMGKKLGVKSFRSAEVKKMTDAQLHNIIAKGKGKMPGYEKSLGADKCKELVRHVRKLGG